MAPEAVFTKNRTNSRLGWKLLTVTTL